MMNEIIKEMVEAVDKHGEMHVVSDNKHTTVEVNAELPVHCLLYMQATRALYESLHKSIKKDVEDPELAVNDVITELVCLGIKEGKLGMKLENIERKAEALKGEITKDATSSLDALLEALTILKEMEGLIKDIVPDRDKDGEKH